MSAKDRIVKRLGCATTSENKHSQCNDVFDTDGIWMTVMAGCHGWASGYLLVYEDEDGEDS